MAQVDLMHALESFELALSRGQIATQPGALDPNLRVHLDHPNGKPRFSYAWLQDSRIQAFSILFPVEPIDGIPCFQIGYATGQSFRGKGLAKALVQATIAEFHNGLHRNGITSFYVEAIVDSENIASQHVAAATISSEPKPVVDEFSKRTALQYLLRMSEAKSEGSKTLRPLNLS